MNRADSEKQWLELESLWKQQTISAEVPAAILNWVRRQERRMYLVIISEWVLWTTLAFYLVKVILAKNLSDTPARLFFAFTVFVLGIGFSLINRRGLWAPLEETAQAYIDLALLRLRRKRREVHFSWLFLFIQLGIIVIWQLISIRIDSVPPLIRNPQEAFLVISGGITLMFIFSTYIYFRTGRERSNLENLQKNISTSCKEICTIETVNNKQTINP